MPASAGESDFRGDQISAPQFRHRARAVDRFADGRRRTCDSHSQRIRWSSQAFADHVEVGVHDDGFRLGATAIDTHHRILRVQAFGWRKICVSSFSAHNDSYGGRKQTAQCSVVDYSRGRGRIIQTKRFYYSDNAS